MYMEHGRTQNKPQKFKKIEIISSIFSEDNSLKLETKLKEKAQKQSNSWRLKNILLNNE